MLQPTYCLRIQLKHVLYKIYIYKLCIAKRFVTSVKCYYRVYAYRKNID